MKAENVEDAVSEILGDEVETEVVEEEVETPEVEGEAESESESESDEVDIVLEGEEEPAPQKIPRRVRKLLERNTALQTDLETQGQASTVQSQEIERLRAELTASKSTISAEMPMPPTEEGCGYDAEKLAAETAQYKLNFANWMASQNQSATQTNTQAEAQSQRVHQETTALEAHYKRADELKVPDYDDNEEAAAAVLGQDAVKSIAMVLPNSAMVINYLGKNPDKAREIAHLDKTDPKAGVAKLWELNFGLKAVPRKRSKAPQPEERVEGAGGVVTVSKLQKQYDEAADKMDIPLRAKLKAQAKDKGITLV